MHFTYIEPEGKNLKQGDVLVKSVDLEKILTTVHPHYKKQDYTHFIILTQSCDLVLRGDSCSTKYISVAAVRPLDIVLRRELDKFQRDSIAKDGNIASVNDKRHMEDFLNKLFNNNASDYFYLESEPEFGLQEKSCAFLRLSVAIKSKLHYSSCLSARILSLKDSFRAKLGWLVGNLYSRVGTEDWTPENFTDKDFKEKIEVELEALCKWIEKEKLNQVIKYIKKLRKSEPELVVNEGTIDSFLELAKVPSKKQQLVDRSMQVLLAQKVISEDSKDKMRIQQALFNDPIISGLIK